MTTTTRKQTLSADEAMQLHEEALVVDAQQPGITSRILFTDNMRAALDRHVKHGLTRDETLRRIQALAVKELQTSQEARKEYLAMWERSGVNVASGTYAASGPIERAFESSVAAIAEARAIIDALDGKALLVLNSGDIERAHREGKYGVILDFQDTLPFGSDLGRIELFRNLGLRVVQLTYNLRNLAGDGCTEVHKSGLSYFGRAMVERLNELKMVVDVSHCSEQVGWDTLEVSSAPIMITHSTSTSVCYHDRGKGDELARAVADSGGFFGVAVIAGFLQESTQGTLDDFADHVEHLVDLIGIDHVGVGSDKAGPGPGTESMFEFPEEIGRFHDSYLYMDPDSEAYRRAKPGDFNWSGFRKEHRLSPEHRMVDFERFDDWPNLTVKLAERGFNEEELRKVLGLNYLRVFRDIVG